MRQANNEDLDSSKESGSDTKIHVESSKEKTENSELREMSLGILRNDSKKRACGVALAVKLQCDVDEAVQDENRK